MQVVIDRMATSRAEHPHQRGALTRAEHRHLPSKWSRDGVYLLMNTGSPLVRCLPAIGVDCFFQIGWWRMVVVVAEMQGLGL